MPLSPLKQALNASRSGRVPGAMGLVAALALLVVALAGLHLSLSQLTQSRSLVLRANAILARMAELQTSIRAAETGQRGFILTGDQRYLAPYEQAVGRIWSEFAGVEGLIIEPSQVERLRGLRPLLQAKLEELAQTVELRRQGFEAAVAVVRTDVGQALMEEIDTLLEQFRTAENTILEARTLRLEANVQRTTWITGLAGLLANLSAVLGVISLGRYRAQMRLLEVEQGHRRHLEGRVEERTAELSEVNRELDAFAYTISHDLRAPLRAMHGYADALEEDYGEGLPLDGQQFIRRIKAAAWRMENLIEDFLTYSRLARSEVSLRPTSLEAAVDGVLSRLADPIQDTRATARVRRPLPEVQAHPPTLMQVIENLVSNALKFVEPGTVPEISIGAEHRDGVVRLWVEDLGIGITPDHAERIFRPFERLHGVEAYPGTGIGLAIVRRAAERMGGTCGVEPGGIRGSRFWVELAAARERSE